MTGHTNQLSAHSYAKNLANFSANPLAEKALAAKSLGATKALGGPELSTWYEQAYTYYNAVMSGAEAAPDRGAWEEFLRQMQWAHGQLTNSSPAWDPMAGGQGNPQGISPQEASDPFGGRRGPNGTWVHSEPSAKFGFTGNDTRDVWSNDITIQVAPVSGKVKVEKTTDTRVSPAEEVLKITVQDPATGTEATYFIHDYQDADIRIETPQENQVENLTGQVDANGKPTLYKVGNFKPGSNSSDSEGQSSVEGELVEGTDNHYLYEGRVGQPLVFRPEGGREEEIHEIYGDATISTRPSDHVTVSKGMPGEAEGHTVTVTHRDGTVDKFYIHKGYEVNLQAKPEYITWVAGNEPTPPVEGEHEEVPDAFKDQFSLNGSEVGEGSDGLPGRANPSHPEDTQPDLVDGNKAHYFNSGSVDLHAKHGDRINEHHITAPGNVVIHGADYTDKFKVSYDATKNEWTIYVYPGRDPNGDPEIYHVTGGDQTKVILDVIGESSIIDSDPEAKRRVQIGLQGAASTGGGSSSTGTTASDRLALIPGIELSAEEIRERGEIASGQQQGYGDHFNPDNLPPIPNKGIFSWLSRIDPELQNLLQNYHGLPTEMLTVGPQIRDRLVVLLQALYPDIQISAAPWDATQDPDMDDDILFGNARIDVIFDPNTTRAATSLDTGWLQFEAVVNQGSSQI